jgi:protein phosphatase
MEVWGKTDKGKVRALNEDNYFIDAYGGDAILGVVCDGMGGANAGEVASGLAVNSVSESFSGRITAPLEPRSSAVMLLDAVSEANRRIYEKSLDDISCSGMGTTLVAALVYGNFAVIANIGDSRAYYIRNAKMTRLTRDHSVVEDLLLSGELTEEEAKVHPKRNLITRALGTEPVIECDIYEQAVAQGDHILLCSDGLTNMAEESEILETVTSCGGERACEELIALANARGGKDNISVVLIKI